MRAFAESRLQRVLGVPGAVLLGLGAIVGTGVYVSIGLAADVAGAAVIPALAIAAALAACNGLSSAQLAATHPVSGGTYEYGYRYLNSWLGFQAGWLFLVAKSASAATAALGFAGYLRSLTGFAAVWQIPLALLLTAVITLVVVNGLRNSSRINAAIVLLSIGALLLFAGFAAPVAWENREAWLGGVIPDDVKGFGALFHAAALMFVAFTGYGRVATLGEEVADPRRTIPLAIIWTIALTFALYVLIAATAIGSTDANALGAAAQTGLPLSWAAEQWQRPRIASTVAIGALFAMAGVLLNLLLGLSRVVLAMARRGDMPGRFARLNAGRTSAPAAVLLAAGLIGAIVLVGEIRLAWSFSAFTVLLYYAITNLAALRVPRSERFVPRVVAVCGLAGCLALAWFVDLRVLLFGALVCAAGAGWHALAKRHG